MGVANGKLDLSLRGSLTGMEDPTKDQQMDTDGNDDDGKERAAEEEGVSERSCDPEITSLEDLDVGKIVRGYVKAVTDVGVFVRYDL